MIISPKCPLLRKNGFAIERRVLTSKAKSLQQQVESAIGTMAHDINMSTEQYLSAVSRWDSPNESVQLLVNELSGILKPLAEEYFGEKLNIVRASIIRKSPEACQGTLGHQDAGYWNINSSSIYDLSTWGALEDIDEKNGALRVLPGSHLKGAEAQGGFLARDFLDPVINWDGDKTLNMVNKTGQPF